MADDTQRTIKTESPFIMPVAVPFSDPGVIGEPATALYTKPPLSDVELLGMMSDLTKATGFFQFHDKAIWSGDQVPLATLFGAPDSLTPIEWLDSPLLIAGRGHRIRADLINAGGEGPGTLIFVCRRKNNPADFSITLPSSDVGTPDQMIIDSGFTGTLSEDSGFVAGPIFDDHFLVKGIHTNLANATLYVNGADGQPWNEDAIPVWSLAGRVGVGKRILRLHEGYLIPAGKKISVRFINGDTDADAEGQLYLKGIRIPTK